VGQQGLSEWWLLLVAGFGLVNGCFRLRLVLAQAGVWGIRALFRSVGGKAGDFWAVAWVVAMCFMLRRG